MPVHVLAKHEMLNVRLRNQHALRASQATGDTHVEKPFDLLVHTSDRLHKAVLVNGPGYRQVLADRYSASAESSAYSSADEALSPSTPPYDCSNTRLA